MARVASGHLLVSVPREPLWRALNIARGAYLRDLGNTPGHVNHWSKRALRRAAVAAWRGRGGTLSASRGPCCCRNVAVAVHAELAERGRGGERQIRLRPRRPDPVGRHRHDRRCHVRVLRARQPLAERGRLQGHLGPVVGAVPDHLDHLPAGRAAALAHDRVAPGAGARGASAAGAADDPADRRDGLPGRGARVPRADRGGRVRRLGRAVLGARRRRARVRGELLRARLARRPPAVRPLRRPRAAGVGLALPVRARGRDRDRRRPGRRRARHRGGAAGLADGRAVGDRAPRSRRARRGQAGRCARAPGSRAPCSRS